jgi:hypothetical protein
MVGRPTGSRSSGQSQSHGGGQEGDPPHAGERIGALTIVRYRKDDGRELILYARARDEQ